MGVVVFALLAIDLPSAPAAFLSGSGNPVLHLVGAQVGGVARALMTVVAFASLFACLIAKMAVATRMVFALARDNMLPGSTALASVGRRTGAPVMAILVITALAHRKGRIPSAPAGAFGLGRWLWPMLVAGLVWWLVGLRRRINAGQAGPPVPAASVPGDPHGTPAA